MSTKVGLAHKDLRRLRFCISSAASLGLAALILWVLVASYEPQATLSTLNLKNNNESSTTLYIELQVRNKNLFRGFNYTTGGWVECFYINTETYWELGYQYIAQQDMYNGFGKSLNWNFSIDLSGSKLDWSTYSEPLKNQEAHIYVSLYLAYWYKILFWTSKTTYYQWLDANAYMSGTYSLKELTQFHRMKNFTIAISS